MNNPDARAPHIPWAAETEVFAIHNFRGNSTEDLPFCRRDVLRIVKPTRDANWYVAKNEQGKEGMIPANYVQKRGEVRLDVMPWFHGKISRQKAEELLSSHEEGLFLVRESTNYPGDYTLCVCSDGKIEHYHIMYSQNKLTIDEESYYENLTKLVEFYEKDAHGLCTKLKRPVAKDGNFDFSVSSQSFREQGWEIKKSEISMGEVIGKGDFGDVLKAEYRGQAVALKSMKDRSRAGQQFLAEASVMTALEHPHLVQLLGVVTGDTIYIVTEFMSRGSLVDYLRSRGRSVIERKDQINFACDTSSGMAYLEAKQLVHRDLAARNVLLNDNGTAKVSDFGLARHVEANQDGGKFPIKWTAPEALRSSKFTNKSDMWSFGILLWEIYSFGRVPYPRIPLAEVVMHIERGYRMEAPDGCPREIYELMQSAWDKDPEKRPSFAMAVQKLKAQKDAAPLIESVEL